MADERDKEKALMSFKKLTATAAKLNESIQKQRTMTEILMTLAPEKLAAKSPAQIKVKQEQASSAAARAAEQFAKISALNKSAIRAMDAGISTNIADYALPYCTTAVAVSVYSDSLSNYAKEALYLSGGLSDSIKSSIDAILESNKAAMQELQSSFQKIIENADAIQESLNLLNQTTAAMNAEILDKKYNGLPLATLLDMISTADMMKIIREQTAAGKSFEEIASYILGAAYKKYISGQTLSVTKASSYAVLNSNPVNSYLSLQDALTEQDPDGQLRFIVDRSVQLTARKAKKKLPEVVTLVSLSYSGDLDGKAAKIKSYDKSVLNSVCSLWQAGNRTISKEAIYRTMTQRDKPTKKQLERIDRSLQKFEGTKIRLDISDEIKNHLLTLDGERITGGILADNMLHIRTHTLFTEKGKKIEAIELLEEPILYTYSKAKKQIIEFPVNLLEIKGTNATEETIVIRDYLLREINQMKNGYRNNHRINYDALLSQVEDDPQSISRIKKGRYTETVCDLLNSFRERGYISDYKAKNGAHNKVIGFDIIV